MFKCWHIIILSLNDEYFSGCKFSLWIVYFVLLSIFAAFVFFPTILIMASREKTNKKTSHGTVVIFFAD